MAKMSHVVGVPLPKLPPGFRWRSAGRWIDYYNAGLWSGARLRKELGATMDEMAQADMENESFVTAKMIAVGAEELRLGQESSDDPETLVVFIYLAMQATRECDEADEAEGERPACP